MIPLLVFIALTNLGASHDSVFGIGHYGVHCGAGFSLQRALARLCKS